jgi:hypothetical protein
VCRCRDFHTYLSTLFVCVRCTSLLATEFSLWRVNWGRLAFSLLMGWLSRTFSAQVHPLKVSNRLLCAWSLLSWSAGCARPLVTLMHYLVKECFEQGLLGASLKRLVVTLVVCQVLLA